jgi:hypothetical protein
MGLAIRVWSVLLNINENLSIGTVSLQKNLRIKEVVQQEEERNNLEVLFALLCWSPRGQCLENLDI